MAAIVADALKLHSRRWRLAAVPCPRCRSCVLLQPRCRQRHIAGLSQLAVDPLPSRCCSHPRPARDAQQPRPRCRPHLVHRQFSATCVPPRCRKDHCSLPSIQAFMLTLWLCVYQSPTRIVHGMPQQNEAMLALPSARPILACRAPSRVLGGNACLHLGAGKRVRCGGVGSCAIVIGRLVGWPVEQVGG